MDARGGLEEIAEQTSTRFNVGTRSPKPGNKWGRGVAPNIARAAPARERPQPVVTQSPLAPAPEVRGPEIIFTGIEISSYTEMINGIQARLGELGIRQVDFDKLAGFADGLSGKVFGSAQVRRLGPEKMFDALRAAGLKLRLEADPQQLQRMQKQIAENCIPRQALQVRMRNHSRPSRKMIDEILSYLASKKGGIARLNEAMNEARSHWARHAAKARHAKTTQRFGNISLISGVLALRAPEDRQALDSCCEEEATAA
jgi:hypothetical protein